MIVLSFKKGQGLGNQLWNYVVLRSVAEHNNYEFKLINYDLFLAKDFLKLQISDTKKVMTPYFTTKKKGTGLGLPIVNKIVNEHSGELVIKKDNGTKIEIWLPSI